MGLKGTGSKSLVAKDVFVPSHRSLPFRHLLDGTSNAASSAHSSYYRAPRHSWAPSGLAAVAVGIALGVVDKFSTFAADRKIVNGSTMADLDTIQLKISESAAEAEASRLILLKNTEQALVEVEVDSALSLMTRARNRRDQAFVTRLRVAAVDRLYGAAGAYALYDGNPLQTAFKDVHAVAGQIVLNFDAAGKSFARVKLGKKPDDIFF